MDETMSENNSGLAFQDAEQCRAWLEAQPVASTVQMQSILQRQLGFLNRAEMAGLDRLNILETLREQIYRTQEECQSRYARRPVPLAIPEQAAYDAAQATWQALADGYVRCLESLLTGELALQSRAAQIVERIMVTFVDKQIDMYHGSQMPPANHWESLSHCLAAAEELSVLEVEVKDRLRNQDYPTTPLAAYAESMLLHLAAPTETSARQMSWLTRWSRRWSRKLALLSEAPEQAPAVPIFTVLNLGEPASHQMPEVSEGVRIFDTTALRQSLKKRMHLLNKGESPAKLQLGEDCTMPAAGFLLEKTYQRWCKHTAKPRRFERKTLEGECRMLCAFDKVQALFPGGVDVMDDVADLARLRREREQMHTLGGMVEEPTHDPAQNKAIAALNEAERWQIIDQSASGLRMLRPYARGQQRIAIGMLAALVFGDDKINIVLATVRWTLVREDGSVEIGVQVMPGQAQTVLVSMKVEGSRNPQRARGLLLGAVPALKESSSLLLPHGWFEAGRVIDMQDGKRQPVRLGQPLERGRDFDRVTFSEAGAQAAA